MEREIILFLSKFKFAVFFQEILKTRQKHCNLKSLSFFHISILCVFYRGMSTEHRAFKFFICIA